MPEWNGLLLVDKPSGPTSHDLVDRVRRVLGIRAVGHAGTLDPFASGLLILGIGKGTKALTALVGLDKTYEVTARLGARTDTFDREGRTIEETTPASPPTRADIDRALATFHGPIKQKAPLFSAIKQGGKKLYDLARAGQATEAMRPERDVTIHGLTVTDYAWPNLAFTVQVSSGTYIRSLVDDLGQALGTGAYVLELRRTAIGASSLHEALPGDALSEAGIRKGLIPVDKLKEHP